MSILVETKGRTAIVTLNNPSKKNALDMDAVRDLTEFCKEIRGNKGINAIVLRGAGTDFCAGADLQDKRIFSRDNGTEEQIYQFRLGVELVNLWQSLPQFTVAAIEGYSVGGGVSLCVACDLRVAAEGARFYVPEILLGSNYGWGTVPRLVELVGPARTKRMVLLAEKIPAQQAESWGLVDFVVPTGAAVDKAMELAVQVGKHDRLPVQITKRNINAHANMLVDVASSGEIEQIVLALIEKEKAI
jgi:enoyl-CoA hydratase